MSGATEATLQELLITANSMNANLTNLNRLISRMNTGGGGSGGGGGGGGGGFLPMAGPANIALGALKVAGSAVSGIFNVLGSIVGKVITGFGHTVTNLYEFSKKAAEGTAKLSDFYDSFRDLPFFLGNLASIAAELIRSQERMLDSYLSMSRAGATFSGSLQVMRDVATRGYMSLEQMTKVVRANAEIFATFTGGIDSGLRKFIGVQNELMGPNSQYAKQLLGLGFTTETVAEMLGETFQQQGDMNKFLLRDNRMIAAAVNQAALELDLFSRATGKNREELEKEQKKLKLDAAFKTFTAGITDPKERERINQAVSRAMAQHGDGAGDMLKQMFMTGGRIAVPLTDASKHLAAATGQGLYEYLEVMHSSARNLNLTSEELISQQLIAGKNLAVEHHNTISSMGDTGALLSMMNNGFVNQIASMNTYLQIGTKTNAEIAEMARKAAEEQDKAGKGTAAGLARSQQQIQFFGLMINNITNQLFGPIAGVLVRFGDTLTSLLVPKFEQFTNWLDRFLGGLHAALDEGGFEGAFEFMFDTLTKAGDELMKYLEKLWKEHIVPFWKTDIKPVLDPLIENMKSALLKGIEKIIDFIIFALRKNSVIARLLFGETEKEREIINSPEYRALMASAGKPGLNPEFDTGARASDGMSYSQILEEAARQIAERKIREAASPEAAAVAFGRGYVSPDAARHSGTIGMTGNWWEKEEEQLAVIRKDETLATKEQIAQIVGASRQEGVTDTVSMFGSALNTLVAINREIAENTKATVRATENLNNDSFQTV